MAKLTATNIEGAYPALDRKKIAKPFVVTGRNYLVDLDGPKSAFGCQKTYDSFNPSQLVQSFRVGAEIFYFSRDANETYLQISQVNWPSRQILPAGRFISSDLTRPKLDLPWSHALVGTYHYFANRTWGVLRYDTVARNWEDVTDTIGVSNIFFITESGGRLCCLAEGIASWSAIDDGMDNTPSTTTSAGFQALSLVGTVENDRDYLGIQKVSRGFLSFTTKGVMRSELIDSVNPFRHLPGEAKKVPLTAWCLTKVTDTDVVMLTRFGLFTSPDGVKFEEYQPIQNEYFKQVEIPPLESLDNGFIALNYSIPRDELYVSFAQSQTVGNYTKAWVLYVKRDSWGSFNRLHKGFAFVDVDNTGPVFQQAFIDDLGKFCHLTYDATVKSIAAQNSRGIYIQQTLEYEPYQVDGVNIMPTNVRVGGFGLSGFPEYSAFYEAAGAKQTQKTANTGPTATLVEIIGSGVGLFWIDPFWTVGFWANAFWLQDDPIITYELPTNVTINSGIVEIGKIAQDLFLASLESEVELGLFRLTPISGDNADQAAADELTLMTNVAISCLDATETEGSVFDDWLADYPVDEFIDWLSADGEEDWGEELVAGSSYTQQIRGSLDGYETFEDQLVALDEVQISGKTKFCSAANVGLFQSVIVTADGVGESYHVKTLELTGQLAGRI